MRRGTSCLVFLTFIFFNETSAKHKSKRTIAPLTAALSASFSRSRSLSRSFSLSLSLSFSSLAFCSASRLAFSRASSLFLASLDEARGVK